jgi:WD40 repeat protein
MPAPILKLHLVNDFPNAISHSIAVCFSQDTAVIATEKYQLRSYNFANTIHCTSKKKEREDDQQPITSMISLESLGIVATSSVDGTVKIWDSKDATLMK